MYIKINDTIKQNQSVVSIIPDACIIIAEFKNLKNIKKGKKAYIYTKDNKFKGKVVDSDKNKVFVSTSGEITKNTEIIKIKIKK